MDQGNTQQPISDDQELAKVLAGVTGEADTEEVAPSIVTTPPAGPVPGVQPTDDAAATPTDVNPVTTPADMTQTADNSELDAVKQQALQELRPLVDKLNVSPEEKFDTYLLLLRSTDDKALIEPAHEAAKNIEDEARRAQALLDIIKEIDFLSQSQKQ